MTQLKTQHSGRFLLTVTFSAFALALVHLSAQPTPPPSGPAKPAAAKPTPTATSEAARKSAEEAAADAQISALIAEIGQQQVVLAKNYDDLDKRLKEFEEVIRQTRIFASRTGKK